MYTVLTQNVLKNVWQVLYLMLTVNDTLDSHVDHLVLYVMQNGDLALMNVGLPVIEKTNKVHFDEKRNPSVLSPKAAAARQEQALNDNVPLGYSSKDVLQGNGFLARNDCQ